MNILITGISGFVGQNLVEYLKTSSNFTIYGLDILLKQINYVHKIYTWNELDDISNIEIIIHLAGIAHDIKNTNNDKKYFDINYGLTKKVYDWFLNSNASKFVFMSSVKAVADTVNESVLDESIEGNPVTAYGRSKLKAEKYILDNLQDKRKSVYILRPTMIHGAGNKGNLNLLYNFIKKGYPYPLGAYKNKRSFTSMKNLCFIIKDLIEKDIASGVYHISDDLSLSTKEIIELIALSLNKKERIWNINKWFINKCAKIGDLFHLPLNSEKLMKLTESYIVSNNKIKKALCIDNMPVSAKEGMKSSLCSIETSIKGK